MNNENEPPPARNSMIAMALNKQSSLLGLKREHWVWGGGEAAILDWNGHCGVKRLGGSGSMLPQENFSN